VGNETAGLYILSILLLRNFATLEERRKDQACFLASEVRSRPQRQARQGGAPWLTGGTAESGAARRHPQSDAGQIATACANLLCLTRTLATDP
jgi:hypothetical protein